MIALLLAMNVHAADPIEPAQLFLQANTDHEAGRHAAAAEGYQTLIDAGLASAPIHLNLGNALLRDEQLGEAIASYRAGLALNPRHADLTANLAYCRMQVADAVTPPGADPLQRTLLFWHHGLGRQEIRLAAGVCSVLFWLALAARRLRPGREWLTALCWGLGLPLVALVGSAVARAGWPTTVGVVLEPEISVYTSTTTDAVVRFKLHEGVESEVVEVRGEWAHIALSDGKRGWVERAGLAEIPR